MHAVARTEKPSGESVQRLEPYRIAVPDPIAEDIDELAELVSRRTGEEPKNVRRGLEIAILSRGVAALRSEEGKR